MSANWSGSSSELSHCLEPMSSNSKICRQPFAAITLRPCCHHFSVMKPFGRGAAGTRGSSLTVATATSAKRVACSVSPITRCGPIYAVPRADGTGGTQERRARLNVWVNLRRYRKSARWTHREYEEHIARCRTMARATSLPIKPEGPSPGLIVNGNTERSTVQVARSSLSGGPPQARQFPESSADLLGERTQRHGGQARSGGVRTRPSGPRAGQSLYRSINFS